MIVASAQRLFALSNLSSFKKNVRHGYVTVHARV
jgi:hypothetical protein